MKEAISKSPIPESKTFRIKDLNEPFFDPNWHFHNEYQLAVVMQGTGTRFVGDNISHFEAGDMVLTGSNLPHVWRNEEQYFQNLGLMTRVIVIYFSPDFMGDTFLNKDEMIDVRELMLRANRGLLVSDKTRDIARDIMINMLGQNRFDGVISLLQILNILSTSNDLKYINKEGYLNTITDSDSERMRAVHAYVLNNFKGNILLEEAASLANLSPTSFSRYFKARANKTFSDFVAELRIGLACKLLPDYDKTIVQIAFECGYKTLSHFNRKFKELTGTSPLKYRKAYIRIR
ncbi:MAG: AraC family transcriptional regulator [Cyclobacteriaceae bacterium]|jgi:AraC-like DNA-binding protein|nr:AraC family transcriptional regulator [Cyclobacteriaceae bacterium]